MLRRTLLLAAAGIALSVSGVAVVPAEAGHRHHRNHHHRIDSVRVGGIGFQFVFERNRYRPHGYYLRVSDGFRVSRRACHRFCFRERRHNYHHRACPALHRHFRHHRPDLLVALRHGPRWREERRYARHDRYHADYRRGRHSDHYYDDYDDDSSSSSSEYYRRSRGYDRGCRR